MTINSNQGEIKCSNSEFPWWWWHWREKLILCWNILLLRKVWNCVFHSLMVIIIGIWSCSFSSHYSYLTLYVWFDSKVSTVNHCYCFFMWILSFRISGVFTIISIPFVQNYFFFSNFFSLAFLLASSFASFGNFFTSSNKHGTWSIFIIIILTITINIELFSKFNSL